MNREIAIEKILIEVMSNARSYEDFIAGCVRKSVAALDDSELAAWVNEDITNDDDGL
jgi:hypothetical protein